jgi:alpha-L-fucosidase
MKTHLLLLTLITVAFSIPLHANDEAQSQRDARLGWWREARFGMFVHWGVYSRLGGSWQGQAYGGYAEHIQRARKIPMAVYRTEVVEKFNPVDFNADEWMRLAKETGMGCFIITAKHHDGFAIYDSKVSDYNIVKATPFKRDPMKELRVAAKKYGVPGAAEGKKTEGDAGKERVAAHKAPVARSS